MGVSKNRGTPKWMVYFMENPIKMDDLGGFPIIFGNTHLFTQNSGCVWPLQWFAMQLQLNLSSSREQLKMVT